MMADVEVFLDWQGRCLPVGLMRRHPARGHESVTFEYDPDWIASATSFSIDPGLPKGPGIFRPPAGQEMFGTLGDCAPDTWGRTRRHFTASPEVAAALHSICQAPPKARNSIFRWANTGSLEASHKPMSFSPAQSDE